MIDAHHHLGPDPDYADRLRESAAAIGFRRVCLVGLPAWKFEWATNAHVAQALRRHPDFFTGFAYLDPAADGPAAVDRWRAVGFSGLKVIRPRQAFDDPSCLPAYERAARYRMPILFHTGMVSRTLHDREYGVRSDHHRPVRLDHVARLVPDANLIGAHLGHPWWDEAGEACRLNANLFADLSGPALRVLGHDGLRRVLWWDAADDAGHALAGTPNQGGAWRHVIFGSDVPADQVATVLGRYREVMDSLGVDAEVQAGVLGGTIARLIGLDPPADQG